MQKETFKKAMEVIDLTSKIYEKIYNLNLDYKEHLEIQNILGKINDFVLDVVKECEDNFRKTIKIRKTIKK